MSWKNNEEFKTEVRRIAKGMKLEIGTIYIRSMTTKWASIRSDGSRVYFNSELLDMKKELGTYVITHELIHLKVPNHGKLFKSLLRLHLEDYEKFEKELSYRGRVL